VSNSINTNVGAQIALESLNTTNADLSVVQKQISTGYRVADATDDGAAYAVAQSIRGTIGALTTANQQLGNTTGLLSTTLTGLNSVSNDLISARDVLVNLASPTISTTERSNYAQQYTSWTSQIKNTLTDSTYQGQTLIGGLGTQKATAANVIYDENADTYSIASFGASAFYHAITLTALIGSSTSTAIASIQALVTATGAFLTQANSIGTYLNTYGAASTYISAQVTFNSDKIDALNTGLGALVDADLAQESAKLQSLQIQQQLATQAITIANQSPQVLLSLVKAA
jgi:flagellin